MKHSHDDLWDAVSAAHPTQFPDNAEAELTNPFDEFVKLSVKERKERFVSSRYAAQLCNVTRRTIQYWVEKKLIVAVRIGKKNQVDLRSLEAYQKKCADKLDAS
ncbi:MAG: helix-turn-helix domain-containing protein [Acidobacteria bacterium]|nr:helix-turn-helix domain-containing protein [Acidobacteriota bacterium]